MKISTIEITAQESETIGELMDLLHDHLNEYELSDSEIKVLNDADEIMYRLYRLNINM